MPLEIPLEGDAEDDRQATDAVATAMQLLEQGARSRTTAANGTSKPSKRIDDGTHAERVREIRLFVVAKKMTHSKQRYWMFVGVHDASSRSHAIIKLRLRASAADTDQRRGRGSRDTEAIVSLVDLAGSERASETKQV